MGKEDSAFNEKWNFKYNNYFDAGKGYLGPAATLPEFGSKGLDS